MVTIDKNDTIFSHVKTSMISVISSLSLKLYLDSLGIRWCIISTSSGRPRKSSVIFGNFLKIFGECSGTFVWPLEPFGTILENLRKSSESGRKSSENHQKRRHPYVYIIKRTLHVNSKIWILCSRGKNKISLVCCAHSWDIVLATKNIKFRSSN